MSKQISEMTLDELRDHALNQAQQLAAARERENTIKNEIKELNDLNKSLQTRNNSLFSKLEQQTSAPEDNKQPEPAAVESCESFAAKFARGEI